MESQKPPPKFCSHISPEMYEANTQINLNIIKQSNSQDLAWILRRLQNTDDQVVPSWSGFNHLMSKSDHPKTVAGMMPIINSPARLLHTLDHFIELAKNDKKMGQRYTVITFDEQLHCKAKLLQWQHQKECEDIVILLGGFHVQMNFSKVIGQHLSDSGLRDIFEESSVIGKNTAENIMKGNGWNHVARAHNLPLKHFGEYCDQNFCNGWMPMIIQLTTVAFSWQVQSQNTYDATKLKQLQRAMKNLC